MSTVSPASSSYNGAGEWLASANLTSVGDEYIGNSLPGPSGGSASSWGAGLGTVRQNCTATTTPVTATATDLVAVDNTIGAPSNGGTIWGAGVYAGCTATAGSGGFHLTLINSTVTANAAPDGPAGVSGESTDDLNLQNTIVYGNTAPGSSDLGGFGIGGGSGSVTATYSDVCAVGSTTSPYAGTGNLCADPKLAGAATGDVDETSSSPTIDAGSNALVPAGVSTDFFGHPRIVGTKQGTPIVDIGAAEWQIPYTAPPTPGTATSGDGQTEFARIYYTVVAPAHISIQTSRATVTSGKAAITLSCAGGVPGTRCRGTLSLTIRDRVRRHRHTSLITVTLARGARRLTSGARGKVTLSLSRATMRSLTLARGHQLRVRATATLSGGRTATRTITLRLAPPHRRHR